MKAGRTSAPPHAMTLRPGDIDLSDPQTFVAGVPHDYFRLLREQEAVRAVAGDGRQETSPCRHPRGCGTRDVRTRPDRLHTRHAARRPGERPAGKLGCRNDDEEIRIRTGSFLPWVVRAWYAGTDEGLYVFAWREARWWRLIEATPEARARIGDATFSVRAVPVEAKSENDAVASAYRVKYSHYADAEQHGRAMPEAAAELFDDARQNSVYQLLRLEPVP